jgi:hypothetical protein
MNTDRPFQIDTTRLRSRPKDASADATRRADQAGEVHGFVDREPKGRRGRRPSPRTGQVHAKVMPEIAVEIAEEAARRGSTQGVIIEEAWKLYKARRNGLE